MILLTASALARPPAANREGFRVPFGGDSIEFGYPQIDYQDGRDRVKPTSAEIVEKGDVIAVDLAYPGDGRVALELREDSMSMRFTKAPSGIKAYRFELHMPIGLAAAGARWSIGGKDGAFPSEHHGPKIYQGNAGDFALEAPNRTPLAFLFPEPFAWSELQDFREWNWAIYGLSVITPFNADKQILVVPFGADAKALPGVRAKVESAFFAKGGGNAPAAPVPTLGPSLSGWGLELECGSMGHFALSHPYLKLDSEDRAKPQHSHVAGKTATLTYRDGGEVTATLEDGKVRYRLTKRPAGYKGAFHEMFIPFRYNQGGKWSVDGASGEFPAIKPAGPKLFQGNGREVGITDADRSTLKLSFPDFSYIEIQDNREWNWSIFWMGAHLAVANQDTWTVSFGIDNSSYRPVRLDDRFGQVPRDFPGKIASEDDLKADAASEDAYYASLDFPGKFRAVRDDLVTKLGAPRIDAPLDRFGGVAGLSEALGLRKTGFFHVERHDRDGRERWFLVDPDGNPFFHLGICCFAPGDDFTDISGRAPSFEWLPPHDGVFGAAWKDRPGEWWNSRAVSFYKANVIRKYERYDDQAHTARLVGRVRAAGFNSIGAFSPVYDASRKLDFPFAGHLSMGGAPELKGVRGMIDPFDPRTAPALDKAFSRLAGARDDPLVIGYFLANEQGLEDIPRAVPRLGADSAAKRELVGMLRKRYGTVAAFNEAWGLSKASFEDVTAQSLAVSTKDAYADVAAFSAELLERYYALVEETFRRYDRNHMLIGSRWQPGTANNEALCRAAGRHLDVISINYYASAIDRAFVQRIHDWTGGKPQFWSEFYYTATREANTGPSSHDLATQRERGLAYRNYVEGAADLGYVVGIEWFTLIDQAATGRFFEGLNGERANTGIFNVADRPYRDLLDGMLAAHLDLYPVWFGLREPYRFDDPRFNASAAAATRTVSAGRATSPIAADASQEGYPLRPPERIGPDRLVLGRGAEGLEASFKVAWDDDALHLLATVVDDSPMSNKNTSGAWLWNGDGLELFLGAEDVDRAGPMIFSDRQILLGAAASGSFYVPNVPEQPAIKTAVVPAADGRGYVLEAVIPWSALGDYKPKEGDTLLFDLAVDDALAGGDRRAQLMWNGSARNSSDRSAWGRLVLVP